MATKGINVATPAEKKTILQSIPQVRNQTNSIGMQSTPTQKAMHHEQRYQKIGHAAMIRISKALHAPRSRRQQIATGQRHSGKIRHIPTHMSTQEQDTNNGTPRTRSAGEAPRSNAQDTDHSTSPRVIFSLLGKMGGSRRAAAYSRRRPGPSLAEGRTLSEIRLPQNLVRVCCH